MWLTACQCCLAACIQLARLESANLSAAELQAEIGCKFSLANLKCSHDVGDDAGPAFCGTPFWIGFAEALLAALAAAGPATLDAVAARCCSTLHSIGPCAVAKAL